MKIKIESDIFDIIQRLKEIDDGYYVVYNTDNDKYEVHNYKQYCNSYCVTCPFEKLDNRLLEYINITKICNIDNIINNIDKNNSITKKESECKRKSKTDYMLREIYNFSNNSSKSLEDNAFSTNWR